MREVYLPLLAALKALDPKHRVIVLSHLDDVTRDRIYEVIGDVLRSRKLPLEKRLRLKSELEPHKEDFRYLLDVRKSPLQKKKKLMQIGGTPMSQMLNTALPLLLTIYPK